MKKEQTREAFIQNFKNWKETAKRLRAKFAARAAAKSSQARSDPFFVTRAYSHVYHRIAEDFEMARGT